MTQATQQEDPWATASQATAAATAPADPNADPFASPDDMKGGGGPRGPRGFAALLDRLIVLKPMEKLLDQPVKSDNDGKTQNIWVCQLTVLGPEKTIEVYSPAREANGVTYPESTEVFETPYTWERWYAYGKGVEVKLDNLEKTGKPFLLGVVKRCSQRQRQERINGPPRRGLAIECARWLAHHEGFRQFRSRTRSVLHHWPRYHASAMLRCSAVASIRPHEKAGDFTSRPARSWARYSAHFFSISRCVLPAR